jgi:hypothetical protein
VSAFAGKYQFTDNKVTFLQISAKDSGLLLKQLWDNQEVSFKRTGALTFYNDERSFPLTSNKLVSGRLPPLNSSIAIGRGLTTASIAAQTGEAGNRRRLCRGAECLLSFAYCHAK